MHRYVSRLLPDFIPTYLPTNPDLPPLTQTEKEKKRGID